MKIEILALIISVFVVCRGDLNSIENRLRNTNADLKNLREDGKTVKFRQIQEKIFRVVSNSTGSGEIKSVSELLGIFDSEAAMELRGLVAEGLMIGMHHKNPGLLWSEFWQEWQTHFAPEFKKAMKDYVDFVRGVDFATLPLTIQKIFEKDELGNSMASMPLGQLVDLMEPTAHNYGIDIRAVFSYMISLKDNKEVFRIFKESVENFEASKFLEYILKFRSVLLKHGHDLPKIEGEKADSATESREDLAAQSSKKENDQTLQLLKPFLVKYLKENKIDLEADAILELASPLLSAGGEAVHSLLSSMGKDSAGMELITQLLPLLNMNKSVSRKTSSGSKQSKSKPNILGGLASLLGGMDTGAVDVGSMLMLASQFMGSKGKKNAKRSKKSGDKDDKKGSTLGLDSVLGLATRLAEGGNLDSENLLLAAAKLLTGLPSGKTDKNKVVRNNRHSEIHEATRSKKTLIEVMEPILIAMKADEKCHLKTKELLAHAKSLLDQKMMSEEEIRAFLPSFFQKVSAGKDLSLLTGGIDPQVITATIVASYKHASWQNFFHALKQEDIRKNFILSASPHVTDLISLLSREHIQKATYQVVMPPIEEFFSSLGMAGINLKNFPERISPLLVFAARSWNLNFSPVPLLSALQDYLIDAKLWLLTSLESIKKVPYAKMQADVEKALFDDIIAAMLDVDHAIQNQNVECLPQLICQVVSRNSKNTLRLYTSRFASLLLAVSPTLEEADSVHFIRVLHAIFDSKDCQNRFPGQCRLEMFSSSHRQMDLEWDANESPSPESEVTVTELLHEEL